MRLHAAGRAARSLTSGTGERDGALTPGGQVVVRLDDAVVARGMLDLRSAVGRILSRGGPQLVVDITAVRQLSSTSLGALLWVRRVCGRRHVRVLVRGATEESVQRLERTGLVWVLDVQDAPEDRP